MHRLAFVAIFAFCMPAAGQFLTTDPEALQGFLLGNTPESEAANPAQPQASEPRPLPQELQPYSELAQRAAAYNDRVASRVWRTEFFESFAPGGEPHWAYRATEALPADLENTATGGRHDGRDVLLLSAAGRGLLDIGPEVRSGYAVEIVAQALSERPCDMSIFVGDAVTGPGFQFGAHYNTRNLLWLGPRLAPPAEREAQPLELPARPLIERGRWHTVRMEVLEDQISVFVDGQPLHTADTAGIIRRREPARPAVYIYASTVALDQVRVESLQVREAEVDRAAAWREVFAEQPPAEVLRQIEQLADLLGHPDSSIRVAAEEMLGDMGVLVVPALRDLLQHGIPEQRQRSRRLLDRLQADQVPAEPMVPAEL